MMSFSVKARRGIFFALRWILEFDTYDFCLFEQKNKIFRETL